MTDYAALLRELAVPRLVGTANHQKVREILKRELSARGFSVEEHAFSGRPARALLGTPREISGVNLIARRSGRPAVRPSIWLVAHYDSKGQPISMALRLVGAVALIAGLAGLLVQPIVGAVVALLGALICALNRVTNNSAGAVDNASAIITILMTLDRLGRTSVIGVILPDAEEFGLVGARALAVEHGALFAGAAVVNLDGIDDRAGPVVFGHRSGPIGESVTRALEAGHWRWLPVVVDGIALRRVARECITILKGDWRTMLIVHTRRDRAERLTLAGAQHVAEGLARALSRA